MPLRKAEAEWKGNITEGSGNLKLGSGAFEGQYSFASRFEEGTGTNPEELVAAAHSGCFTMALSFALNQAGFTADNIDTKCTITLENGAITESHLEVTAKVPGIDKAKFDEVAAGAKANCPISKLLNTTINMEATLA